jgi:glycosyltransferase involved in cell wall biosynthesis
VKLLVFAHKPPPHHGQSFMVQLLLENVDRQSIELYHVDCRLSKAVDDIGSFRLAKLLLLLKYCSQAIWLRLRHGVRSFYFIPAMSGRAGLYRDWLVMALCRPFFKRLIYHWEAAGLGEWLSGEARGWERSVSKLLLHRPDLSIVLGEFNRRDAEAVQSRRTGVVPNGIPDPCPQFDKEVLPGRLARVEARKRIARGEKPVDELHTLKVLYMGLCFSEKGLFDAVEAIALANQKLRGTAFSVKLTVAGNFYLESEKQQFEKRIAQSDLQIEGAPCVEYRGFVSGEKKSQLLREHDCLCFPTWYSAESFGIVLVEAMAYGMMIIATKWRAVPELLPAGYGHIVEARSPVQIAETLVKIVTADYDPRLRQRFLERYTVQEFARRFIAAAKELEQ